MTTQDNINHIPEDDLVLFALQLLPEERMQEAKQHLSTCEQCRAEVAKIQGDLVAYSITAEMQAPPAAARDRLMRQVAREPRLVQEPEPVPVPVTMPERRSADRREGEGVFAARQSRILGVEARPDAAEEFERRRPSRLPWVLAFTGWAVAAGCSFFAGLQVHQRQQLQSTLTSQEARLDDQTRDFDHAKDALATLTAANSMQVALHLSPAVKTTTTTKAAPETGPTPDAMAAYLADKGALVFIATHMQPVATGKTYELWLLPADGKSPIPAGTFRPDAQGNASVVLPALPRGVPAKGFGITVENDGGSQTPTLPIVMSGT